MAVTPESPRPPSRPWWASSLVPQWSPNWALAGTAKLKAGAEASGVAILPGPTRFQPSATCSADPARLRTGNPDATPLSNPRGPTSPSANTDELWSQQLCLPLVSAASLHAQWQGHPHTPCRQLPSPWRRAFLLSGLLGSPHQNTQWQTADQGQGHCGATLSASL